MGRFLRTGCVLFRSKLAYYTFITPHRDTWFAVFDLIRNIGAKGQQKDGPVIGMQAFYSAYAFSIVIAIGRSDRIGDRADFFRSEHRGFGVILYLNPP